jgi:hypothetical protein
MAVIFLIIFMAYIIPMIKRRMYKRSTILTKIRVIIAIVSRYSGLKKKKKEFIKNENKNFYYYNNKEGEMQIIMSSCLFLLKL